MARDFQIGDWVNTPSIAYEVEITGRDTGTGDLIVRYVLDNGRDAYRTVPVRTAALYVDPFAASVA